jgi:hypothetical protein
VRRARRCLAGAGAAAASGKAAREASVGKGGVRIGRAGVRQASPAGRWAENGSEEAVRRKTAAAGGASMSGALHGEAKGRVRAQTVRGDGGGAVGASSPERTNRRRLESGKELVAAAMEKGMEILGQGFGAGAMPWRRRPRCGAAQRAREDARGR